MIRYVGFEIKALDNMIMRKILANVRGNKRECLMPIQAGILRYLFVNSDKEIYQRDLEKEFLIRRSTISGILSTMEKNKMIRRIDSSLDLRVKRIILTNDCLERINSLEKETEKFEENLCMGITDEELEMFFSVIDKIKDNLSK